MAKSIEKKIAISTSKKTINKTKKQKEFVESIPLKRLTRSNTSEILLKSKEQKKSASEIPPRVTRLLKITEVSSKLAKKTEHKENNQHQISNRVTRSLKSKEVIFKSNIEEEKKQNFDLRRVTRPLKKNSQSNDVSSSIPVSFVRTENRIEKRHIFIKLESFGIGSICLAKQKYSCPWPARVEKIEGDKILVFFFGDKRVGYVESSEIYDFTKSLKAVESILFAKRIPRGYKTGVVEIEYLLGIDNTQSILNKI